MQSESCPSEVINAGRCNMPGEQQVESSWANRCDSWDSLTETMSKSARLHIKIQAEGKKKQELCWTEAMQEETDTEEKCDIMQQPEAFKAALFYFLLNGISLSVWQRSFSPENNIQLCSGKHHAMGTTYM